MVCGKVVYTTKGEAMQAHEGVSKRRKSGGGKAYLCDDCQGWHTTSGGRKGGGRHRRKHTNITDKQEVVSVKPKKETEWLKIKKY